LLTALTKQCSILSLMQNTIQIQIPKNLQNLVQESLEEWGMEIPKEQGDWQKIIEEFLSHYFKQ
jgi:hypothetical protein